MHYCSCSLLHVHILVHTHTHTHMHSSTCRYVSITDRSPELALAAVKILHLVSMTTKSAKDMASCITADKVKTLCAR